jgi:hypothetical protein
MELLIISSFSGVKFERVDCEFFVV